jgi:hypothetical protein
MNHFDQASRFAAKLDAIGFLRWLLDDPAGRYRFRRWLDARRLPFPGDPEGFCDTVAEIDDRDVPSPPWAVPVEFQSEPDPAMFGRFLMYLGQLWLELRPDEERGSRYQVGGIVVNLTGRGVASRDMKLGETPLRTALGVVECNMAEKDAQAVLDGIAAGAVARCLLPWIPLMHGGGVAGIIERWKGMASAESDERRRGEYGQLALVFAEAAGCAPAWKNALKEWNVKQSQQVLEWQAEAKAEAKAEAVLEVLATRLATEIPSELAEHVRSVHDLGTLTNWLKVASTTPSLDDFRRAIGASNP